MYTVAELVASLAEEGVETFRAASSKEEGEGRGRKRDREGQKWTENT